MKLEFKKDPESMDKKELEKLIADMQKTDEPCCCRVEL